MKRVILLLTAAAVLACSSAPKLKVLRPEIQFLQLVGPADLNYPSGQIEVQYGVRVANRSSEPITLKQIRMEPVGGGGPYTLRRETYYFNQQVAPDHFSDVTFWARASAEGNANAGDAHAPVTVRAIAVFDTPNGSIREVVMSTLQQYGSGKDRQ